MLKDLSRGSPATRPRCAPSRRSCTTRCARSRSTATCSTEPVSAPPRSYGSSVDPARERYWLFIENVEGDVLWQVGELDVWEEAARWLASCMPCFAGTPRAAPGLAAALRARAVRRSGSAALAISRGDRRRAWSDDQRAQVLDLGGALRARSSSASRRCRRPSSTASSIPRTCWFSSAAGAPRICPIDWEIAAIGPGLLDLAALTIGKWTPGERDALARAYREAPRALRPAALPADFDRTLECCRLHLAVQWLGWEPEWVAPAEHRHDWLAEALRSAGELGLQ